MAFKNIFKPSLLLFLEVEIILYLHLLDKKSIFLLFFIKLLFKNNTYNTLLI